MVLLMTLRKKKILPLLKALVLDTENMSDETWWKEDLLDYIVLLYCEKLAQKLMTKSSQY